VLDPHQGKSIHSLEVRNEEAKQLSLSEPNICSKLFQRVWNERIIEKIEKTLMNLNSKEQERVLKVQSVFRLLLSLILIPDLQQAILENQRNVKKREEWFK